MARRVARQLERDTKTGHDRWLVSYSDFITLLFAFFVVMYSISQVNEEKYRTLTQTLNDTFIQRSVNDSSSEAEEKDNDVELASLDDLQSSLENVLDSPASGVVAFSANENWIELTLPSELLFESGSAETKKEAIQIFNQISDLVAEYENEIQVVGHTDNVPISNQNYKNNWYLSSARAVAIVNYLSFQGVSPERLSAIGFGEYRPVADNSSEEGRAKNRRVVLRVSSQSAPAQKSEVDTFFSDPDLAVPLTEDRQAVQSTNVEAPDINTADDEDKMTPIKLKGGDLLFTSDPELPRLREREDE